MDFERWKKIDSLLQQALDCPGEDRDAFLQSACQGDAELRREIESLLKSHGKAAGFLEQPAIELAARDLSASGLSRSDSRSDPESWPPDSASGQLRPGTILAGRYTVLGLSGRGGMGEVYRARDNKLDQVVALKLITQSLRRSTMATIRLHNEVRLARQVSHPNVCRVYDIGESDGLHFLTMEFVDGEDLAHLLKRIGRFPQDKGIEIARRICAALSAAHERGVLHRDLKPGNVMLSSSGRVVVTDFGLAAIPEDSYAVQSRSGTPAYMAPEQVAAGPVSVRSDIYSLGLVLYELFTGRPAFESADRANLTKPSLLVIDLDPDVERVILRCLAPEPESRPATAMAVAASLPGGDPLELALAAGQTPPPEMVAASGEKTGISVRAAVCCLLGALVALAAAVTFGGRPQVLTRAPMEATPDGLAARARELAASFGYPGQRDRAFGFLYDAGQIQRLEREGWANSSLSSPSPVRFWYRESAQPLASYEMRGIAWNDPPDSLPGMLSMQLDAAGRLTYFRALPHARSIAAPHEANWTLPLNAAGLDPNSLRPTTPRILPPVFADSRLAWTGSFLDRPEAPVRVEAAALAGRPVYFRLIPAWETDSVNPSHLDTSFQVTARPYPPFYSGSAQAFLTALGIFIGWVAWRNVSSGRGDRRGALRVAVFVFALWFIYGMAVGFGQLAAANERSWIIAAHALYWAGIAWMLYIALEPLVRRRWPNSLVSWSRLISGRFRDPLVGRDILIGILTTSWFFLARTQLPITIGSTIPVHIGALLGVVPVSLATGVSGALSIAVVFTLTLAGFRRKWAAFLLTAAILFILNFFQATGRDLLQVSSIVMYSLVTAAVLLRFGFLACYTAMATSYLLFALPLGPDFDRWYEDPGRACVLLLVVVAVYAFHSALAERRVIREELIS